MFETFNLDKFLNYIFTRLKNKGKRVPTIEVCDVPEELKAELYRLYANETEE